MMPDDELAAIRAREAAATPGPWDADYEFLRMDDAVAAIGPRGWDWQQANADAEFIAHARTDIPALLTDHDAVVAENARLRAGIAGLRLEHSCCDSIFGWINDEGVRQFDCNCGTAQHNAKVDALLKGDT